MNEIILSVLIPTYNRYKYLKDCLKASLSLKSDEYELIVQDNTENNEEILAFINQLNDRRIKYYHVKEHLCVSDNCDLAMSHAGGEYICMIGDDDTICENIIDAAKFCKKNNIDAVNYFMPGFNWPDMTFEGKDKEANMFYTDKADGTVVLTDAKDELYTAIKTAEGLSRKMPRAYHGLVSKKCMDKIYKKTGTYFPGPSPDMANAVAVCLAAERTALVKDYMIVSGYGYNSARGEGNRQKHYGRLNEKPWLPKDILERWDKELPRIFSGETIYADSLIEALRRMGREDLVKQYNYASLYAMFLSHHRNAFIQMLCFCIINPIRCIRMIRGIVIRSKVRKVELKNKEYQSNFREEIDVTQLQDAQNRVRLIREELGISKLLLLDQ